MIDLHQPNMHPANDILKNLVYAGGKSNVLMTVVNGIIRYEKGEYALCKILLPPFTSNLSATTVISFLASNLIVNTKKRRRRRQDISKVSGYH